MKVSYQVLHGLIDASAVEHKKKEKVGSFQPKWDQWGRLTEPLLSTTPALAIVGNHDPEPQVP